MRMDFGPAFWILCAIAALAALAYGLVFLNRPPNLARAAVKTLFMAAMAAAFVSANAPHIFITALITAAFGDFLLAWPKSRAALGAGILAFLVMQALYFLIFFGLWIMSGENAPLWPRYAAMALIAITTFAFLIWLAPKLGWLALGVVPYAIAIAATTIMAMWLPWAGWAAMLGMLLFFVSDGVLAAELFRLPADSPARRLTAPLVWWTYAFAQGLIAAGVVLAARAMV
ncbi:MAG: lysoplasmalogenase family protein [Hyphomonadaceae bacterium]